MRFPASTPPASSPAHTESGVRLPGRLSLAAAMTFSYLAARHMAGL